MSYCEELETFQSFDAGNRSEQNVSSEKQSPRQHDAYDVAVTLPLIIY